MGGRRDGYLYIIDCLSQEVAFPPKVIKCAVGAIKGNKMRLRRNHEWAEGGAGGRGCGFSSLMK
jgi:hypothetical protein